MRSRYVGPRWWAILLGAALLMGCSSPSDVGHRIYGYVDSQGRLAVAPAFLDARSFREGLAAVQVAGGWGYVDRDGRWAVEPRFEMAQPFHGGLASVTDGGLSPPHEQSGESQQQLGGRGQLIDTRGRIVRDVGNATIAPPDRGLARIGTEMRWGFAPANGGRPDDTPFATRRLVFAGVQFVDHRPLDFSEDRALVSRMAPHRWLLLDDQGQTRASAELEWLEEAGSGVYAFVEDQRWGLADDRLREVSGLRFDSKPNFEGDPPEATLFDESRAGCVDRRGRWVLKLDPAAVIVWDCNGPLLPALKAPATGLQDLDLQDLRFGVVDRAGRWRIPPQFKDVTRRPGPPDVQFFKLQLDEQWALAAVGSRGWRRSAPADLEICDHAEACFSCSDDGCRRLDPQRLQPEGPVYDEVKSAPSTGDVLVRRGSLWGYRRVSGRLTLPIEYEEIDPIHGWNADSDTTMARVRRNGRWGAASLDTGRVLVPPGYEEIGAVRGELLLAKENDRWVLVTVDGRSLADPAPDWVQGIFALANFSDSAWAVLTGDARLYLVDKRTMDVREVPAPAGYRWCTTNCYPRAEIRSIDFRGDLQIEADGRPRRYVLLGSDGRSALPLLLDRVTYIGPLGAGVGPYIVWVAGRCGVVTREGAWLAPLAYDHCDPLSRGPGLVMLGREAYAIPAVPDAGP